MKILCLQFTVDDFAKSITNNDTAFGNRLIYWVHCYRLSNLIKDSKVVVSYETWPEALLLNFPNTISKKLSKFEIDNSFPISEDQYKYILRTKDVSFLDNKKNYYLDLPGVDDWDNDFFLFYETKSYWQRYYSESISKIKLKVDVGEFFKKEFKNVCWIHIRRGNETHATEEFLEEIKNTFSPEDYNSYWNTYNLNRYQPDCVRVTTSDRVYFGLLDEIVHNRNKKIYISSDIDSKYFSHYVSRYGNDIIDRNIIFKKFLNFYKEEFFIKERYNPTNIKTVQLFYNIFDLFVGINSDIVIVSESTWGYIPRYYHKQKDYILLHGNDIHESNIIMYSKSDKWLPGDYKG